MKTTIPTIALAGALLGTVSLPLASQEVGPLDTRANKREISAREVLAKRQFATIKYENLFKTLEECAEEKENSILPLHRPISGSAFNPGRSVPADLWNATASWDCRPSESRFKTLSKYISDNPSTFSLDVILNHQGFASYLGNLARNGHRFSHVVYGMTPALESIEKFARSSYGRSHIAQGQPLSQPVQPALVTSAPQVPVETPKPTLIVEPPKDPAIPIAVPNAPAVLPNGPTYVPFNPLNDPNAYVSAYQQHLAHLDQLKKEALKLQAETTMQMAIESQTSSYAAALANTNKEQAETRFRADRQGEERRNLDVSIAKEIAKKAIERKTAEEKKSMESAQTPTVAETVVPLKPQIVILQPSQTYDKQAPIQPQEPQQPLGTFYAFYTGLTSQGTMVNVGNSSPIALSLNAVNTLRSTIDSAKYSSLIGKPSSEKDPKIAWSNQANFSLYGKTDSVNILSALCKGAEAPRDLCEAMKTTTPLMLRLLYLPSNK